MRKNLHISKICCTFAPDLKNKTTINPGGNGKQRQKVMFKISWTNYKGETGIINATVFNTIEAAKKRIKQLNAMRGNWQIVKYNVVAA